MPSKNITIEGKTLPIREFKLRWMCENPIICMIAKRGSGKSWVCRSILKHLDDEECMPGGMIIAPTDRMNTFYGHFFPGLFIHYKYTTDALERLFYRQTKIKQKKVDKKKLGKKVDSRALLLMDDCLSSKTTWMKDPPIPRLFFDGRHYDITFILTMQFPLGITTELRGNFDYIFLLADDFYSNQRRLFDHYAGMFPSLDAFRTVFTELTKDFGAMVIVNRGNRKNIWDKIFWFRAKEEKMESFGCKQFRTMHDKNYDKHWMEKEYDLNMQNLLPSKRGSGQDVKVQLIK